MRAFINRIKEDYNNDWAWDREPLYFKALMLAIVLPYWISKAIFAIVAFLTAPIWGIPYAIWWTRRNKE